MRIAKCRRTEVPVEETLVGFIQDQIAGLIESSQDTMCIYQRNQSKKTTKLRMSIKVLHNLQLHTRSWRTRFLWCLGNADPCHPCERISLVPLSDFL